MISLVHVTIEATRNTMKSHVCDSLKQPTLNKKEDDALLYLTPGTGHFMVFLVASHVTTPKGQLPDEDREIRTQRR